MHYQYICILIGDLKHEVDDGGDVVEVGGNHHGAVAAVQASGLATIAAATRATTWGQCCDIENIFHEKPGPMLSFF
jgi:hypothetical protein